MVEVLLKSTYFGKISKLILSMNFAIRIVFCDSYITIIIYAFKLMIRTIFINYISFTIIVVTFF